MNSLIGHSLPQTASLFPHFVEMNLASGAD
jgi:hypothetical protein